MRFPKFSKKFFFAIRRTFSPYSRTLFVPCSGSLFVPYSESPNVGPFLYLKTAPSCIIFFSKPFPSYRLATSEGVMRLKISRDEKRWEVNRLKSTKSSSTLVAAKARKEDEVCPFSDELWETPWNIKCLKLSWNKPQNLKSAFFAAFNLK